MEYNNYYRLFFPVNPGINVINRRSTDSSVTIPFERTFGNLNENESSNENSEFNFCGCGWPQHMLLPKGNTQGLKFQLFVMISNYEDDRVSIYHLKFFPETLIVNYFKGSTKYGWNLYRCFIILWYT